MVSDNSLQAGQIQSLLDKQAVHELIHAYCRAMDRRDYASVRRLYHEDAIDDHGGFFKGLAMEFVDRLPAIQAPMEILHHNVTTVNLSLGSDSGEGEVYVLAYHRIAKEGGGSMDFLVGGRYLDKYEKRDGCWKFSHRVILADWGVAKDPSIVDLNSPLFQGSLLGSRGGDDPACSFFSSLRPSGPAT
ncbi:MAG: nuclear transport factor 2 family protein [Proteobacteria bacterium]|nr:nuclear transport factor 2 family protein [Pseudomonadota bacterium]HQR03059.1 nuclear transport factor 2 family protein [Rhodocyclaceae bacterium]